jgi:hypothetical protein
MLNAGLVLAASLPGMAVTSLDRHSVSHHHRSIANAAEIQHPGSRTALGQNSLIVIAPSNIQQVSMSFLRASQLVVSTIGVSCLSESSARYGQPCCLPSLFFPRRTLSYFQAVKPVCRLGSRDTHGRYRWEDERKLRRSTTAMPGALARTRRVFRGPWFSRISSTPLLTCRGLVQ